MKKTRLATLVFLSFLWVQCSLHPIEEKENDPSLRSGRQVDKKGISQTIRSHHKYIRQCYGQILTKKGNEKSKGQVMLHFKIGPDGKAFETNTIPEKSSLKNDSLNQCLFAGLQSWDFPVHPDGEEVEVKYPLRFDDRPPADMQKKLNQFEKLRNQ